MGSSSQPSFLLIAYETVFQEPRAYPSWIAPIATTLINETIKALLYYTTPFYMLSSK